MPDYAIFDASSSQVSTSVPAPGERLTPAGAQQDQLADWRPNDSPIDGHDEPYQVIGDEIAPPDGDIPSNIVTTPAGPFGRTKD